jgi:murein DD-endopeptidase MepM/ murein hydrolase activator NlpD
VSLYYQLPDIDRERLSNLREGTELALLFHDGDDQPVGLAVKDGLQWYSARQGIGSYQLREGLSHDDPMLTLHDFPLSGSLEQALAGSDFSDAFKDELTNQLGLGFRDDAFEDGEWLRLRVLRQSSAEGAADIKTLMSAAVTGEDKPRFMVRYQAKGEEPGFYNDEGQLIQPGWISTPLKGNYRVTSEFNPHRRHPVTGRVRPHNGRDFAARPGTPVVAASYGEVIHAGWQSSWGRLVVLRHSNGIETRYAHLQTIKDISVGDSVSKGDTIGAVGTSGLSTGPHLHFEIYQRGLAMNPASFSPDKYTRTALAPADAHWLAQYHTLETASLSRLPVIHEREWLARRDRLSGQGGPDETDEDRSRD